MFGISGVELLLILVFAFLILGPDKLPEMAKTAGRAIARFRDAQQDMNEALKEADLVDGSSGNPLNNPVDVVERVAKVAADGKSEEVVKKVTSAAAAAASSMIKPSDDEEKPAAVQSEASDEAAGDAASETKTDSAPMSFAERKARYERERAAREAAAAAEAAADDIAPESEGAVESGDDAAGAHPEESVGAATEDAVAREAMQAEPGSAAAGSGDA